MTTAVEHLPHHVYRYVDADGAVLYIGCTTDVVRRDHQHRSRGFYPDVHHIEFETFPDRWAGRIAEREAIRRWLPKYNKQMLPRSLWLTRGQTYEEIEAGRARLAQRGPVIFRRTA